MYCDRCHREITVENKMIDALCYWSTPIRGERSGDVCEKCYEKIKDEDAKIQGRLEIESYNE